MTLYHYRILDEDWQVKVVETKGVLIDERERGAFKILLYHVHSFYVEMYYHKHFNVLHKIRSFNSTDLLKPYLKKINIAELVV